MCGIAGIVHRQAERPVSQDIIGRMCDAIRHRGPDDEGSFFGRGAALAMRRLSIIDLAGSHQPIANEDGSKVIVFNGEIYNYGDLRPSLLSRGHQFRTSGDTETILHLYEDEGPRCVERLRGMFAFAIWDAREETLFLARDRFGIKPLYLASDDRGIAFASELKALHAVGYAAGPLDWEALDMYFQLGYIPAPATPFRSIRKLEPGHWLTFCRRTGEMSIRQYWDLPEASDQAPADAEDQVLEWLDNSVAAHLVSDVPVAAFLSGGLDSSAVVASMALRGERPHAFTVRYSGTGAGAADESVLAAGLARRYGAKLTVVDVAPEIGDFFERTITALDEPLADDSAIPTWTLSELVSSQYKVALTGIGGDELFAGYWRHLGLVLGETYAKLPSGVRGAAAWTAGHLREPGHGGLGIDRVKRFLGSGSTDVPNRFLGYVTRLRDDERRNLYGRDLRATVSGTAARDRFRRLYVRGGSPGGLAGGLYLDYKTYLPDDILALSDRLSMAHSLEVRVPFVDHELVERVFPLSERLKIGGFRKKRLLKLALRKRLTEEQFKAPKRGFVGPTGSWLRHELRPMLQDELSAARMRELGYFDADVVQRLMQEHFEQRHNREGILWALLCFSLWHRSYAETGVHASATT